MCYTILMSEQQNGGQTMSTEHSSSTKKRNNKTVGFILTIVITLGVVSGLLYGASAAGFLQIALKQPGTTVAISSITCDQSVVDRFNTLVDKRTLLVNPGDTQMEPFTSLLNELKAKSGFADDPTCQFIQYYTAVGSKDASVAEQSVTVLQSLVQKGKYVNTSISGIQSTNQMLLTVAGLKGEKNPVGSG